MDGGRQNRPQILVGVPPGPAGRAIAAGWWFYSGPCAGTATFEITTAQESLTASDDLGLIHAQGRRSRRVAIANNKKD